MEGLVPRSVLVASIDHLSNFQHGPWLANSRRRSQDFQLKTMCTHLFEVTCNGVDMTRSLVTKQ